MTTTDSNGIIRYQTTDPVSPLHTLLNLGMQSVSDALTPLKAGPVLYSQIIPASGVVASSTGVISPGSSFTFSPSRSGTGQVIAELNDVQGSGAFGFLLMQILVDGSVVGQTRFYEGEGRRAIQIVSWPFPVTAGVNKTVALNLAVYSVAGTPQVGTDSSWRASVS